MKSPQQSYRVPELCWTLIPIYLSAEITISLMNFWAALIRLFLFSSTFWPFSSLKWENRNTHNLGSVIRNASAHWFSGTWSYFKRELCFRTTSVSFTLLKERQKLNDLSLNGREASKSLANKQLRPLLIVTKTTPGRVKPGFHRRWISRSFATNLSKSRTQKDHNSVVNQPCRIHFKWDMFFVHRSYQRCK